MEHNPHRNPAAVSQDAGVPSPQLDAHGFDPNDFEWRPVPRRPRRDGWSPAVQRAFIEALAQFGMVERACEAVNMSVGSAYSLRHAPGGESFAAAWDKVLARAAQRMLDIAFEHAILGEEVPVFDRDGRRVGVKHRYNTRMAMFLLRGYFPERFRHAHRDTRSPDEVLPPPPAPLAEIVAPLLPETPAEPHRLATPERLDELLGDPDALAAADQAPPAADHEPYRHRTVPDDHPSVQEQAARNRWFRERREAPRDAEWAAHRARAGLDFASTSDDASPPDPRSDYTYWAQEEARRQAAGAAAPVERQISDVEDWDEGEEPEDGGEQRAQASVSPPLPPAATPAQGRRARRRARGRAGG